MSFRLFVGALALTGCAGQSSTTHSAPAVRYVSAAGSDTPSMRENDIDATRLAEAKKRGYTLVNSSGEALYCRSDFKTGSRVQTHTTCMTATELDQMREQTRESLRTYTRPIPFSPTGK